MNILILENVDHMSPKLIAYKNKHLKRHKVEVVYGLHSYTVDVSKKDEDVVEFMTSLTEKLKWADRILVESTVTNSDQIAKMLKLACECGVRELDIMYSGKEDIEGIFDVINNDLSTEAFARLTSWVIEYKVRHIIACEWEFDDPEKRFFKSFKYGFSAVPLKYYKGSVIYWAKRPTMPFLNDHILKLEEWEAPF